MGWVVVGFVANKWNHWAEHQVCERFQIQCTLRQIAEAGGFLMREARPWGSNAVFLFPTSVRIPTRILGHGRYVVSTLFGNIHAALWF
jgi:hypothetical protein